MNLCVVLAWSSRAEKLPDHKLVEIRAGSKEECIASVTASLEHFASLYNDVDWAINYLRQITPEIEAQELPGGISLEEGSPLVDGWKLASGAPAGDLLMYFIAWN